MMENKKLETLINILLTAAAIAALVSVLRAFILIAMLIAGEDVFSYFLKTLAWLCFGLLLFLVISVVEAKMYDWKPRHQYLLDLLAQSRASLAALQTENAILSVRYNMAEFDKNGLSEKLEILKAEHAADLQAASNQKGERLLELKREFDSYKSVTVGMYQGIDRMKAELEKTSLELNAMRLLVNEVVLNGKPADLEGLIRKVISSNPSTFNYIEV